MKLQLLRSVPRLLLTYKKRTAQLHNSTKLTKDITTHYLHHHI
jgi:hypothetical protein